MKNFATIAMLVLGLQNIASAEQWVCPEYPWLEYTNGFSEYYCEECVGNYASYTLSTGTPPGDRKIST